MDFISELYTTRTFLKEKKNSLKNTLELGFSVSKNDPGEKIPELCFKHKVTKQFKWIVPNSFPQKF